MSYCDDCGLSACYERPGPARVKCETRKRARRMPHDWMTIEVAGWFECKRCGHFKATCHVTDPLRTIVSYFDAAGDRVDGEPLCVEREVG